MWHNRALDMGNWCHLITEREVGGSSPSQSRGGSPSSQLQSGEGFPRQPIAYALSMALENSKPSIQPI